MTPSGPVVRFASTGDNDALYAILMRLSRDNPDPAALGLDHEKIKKFITAACKRDGCVAGVIDGPSGLVASVGLFPFLPWYAADWVISVHWLYVDSECRGGGKMADALFRFSVDHSRELSRASGVPLGLEISFVSRTRIAARTRLWSKYANQVGAMFFVAPEEVSK